MPNIKPAEHLADIWLLTRDTVLLDLELFPRDIFSTICLHHALAKDPHSLILDCKTCRKLLC